MAAEMWLIIPTGTYTSWADGTEQEQINIIWLSLSWVWFQGEIKFSLSHPIVSSKTWESESEREVTQSCPTLCNPMDPYHASPSMGFSQQEYWSGLSLPSPEDLPDPGIRRFTVWATREVISFSLWWLNTHTHTYDKIETLLMESLLTDIQQVVFQLLHSSLESCRGNLIRKQVFSPVLALPWVH